MAAKKAPGHGRPVPPRSRGPGGPPSKGTTPVQKRTQPRPVRQREK